MTAVALVSAHTTKLVRTHDEIRCSRKGKGLTISSENSRRTGCRLFAADPRNLDNAGI